MERSENEESPVEYQAPHVSASPRNSDASSDISGPEEISSSTDDGEDVVEVPPPRTPVRVQRTLHAFLPALSPSGEIVSDATPEVNLFEVDRSLVKSPKKERSAKEKRHFKPRIHMTYKEKKKVIEAVDETSIRTVCAKQGLAISTVKGFLKAREEIYEKCNTLQGSFTKSYPLLEYGDLAKALMKHIVDQRLEKVLIGKRLAIFFCNSQSAQFAALAPTTKLHTVSRMMNRDNRVLRKPTSVAQKEAPVGEIVKLYENIRGCLSTAETTHPNCVVMLDETSIVWRPVAQRVIEARGAKTVTVVTKGNEKQTSTALLGGIVELYWNAPDRWSAIKQRHIKPLVLFKGKPDKQLYKRMQPIASKWDVEAEVTENGWITTTVFADWAKRHLSNLPQPAWVFLDGHTTHRATVEVLEGLGMTVWFIPHGCTSKIQPHDTHINAPFKASLRNSFSEHLSAHPRAGDKRGEVNYTDILRWVRIAMTSVPETLLTQALEKNLLCSAALRGVGKEDEDRDKAYAKYLEGIASEKAEKAKAKQDAIDLKAAKAAERLRTAQAKRDATQKALDTKLQIIQQKKELAEALLESKRLEATRKSPADKKKKKQVAGVKRPRVKQTVSIGNINGPVREIVINNGTISTRPIPAQIYGKPRPPFMDEEGTTDQDSVESDAEVEDLEAVVEPDLLEGIIDPEETSIEPQRLYGSDDESWDETYVDCVPDWTDDASEQAHFEQCADEDEYFNNLMARTCAGAARQKKSHRFPPRSAHMIEESHQDEEEEEEDQDHSDVELDEADINFRHNDNGEFLWDEEAEEEEEV